MQLISFDVQSDFGFFRKPETNNTLNVSYNMLHKPALLGILGAIIGLKGYRKKGQLPEYYEKLKNIQVGIAPTGLNHDKGNFTKTSIKYSNTVGYANKGTNFLTEELTLISPKYKVYLMLEETIDEQAQLLDNLERGRTEFIPYFGKNEFTAWWSPDSFKRHNYQKATLKKNEAIRIKTLFLKNQIVSKNAEMPEMDFLSAADDNEGSRFIYFERLPVGFNLELMQYELREMVYSNFSIKIKKDLANLYQINGDDSYVQLH
jgi:CRISPR-associated protein Cas5h